MFGLEKGAKLGGVVIGVMRTSGVKVGATGESVGVGSKASCSVVNVEIESFEELGPACLAAR